METLDRLGRKIGTAEDLRAIVKTMKALAAVGMRQCEAAAAALGHYAGTVERGLQGVLRDHVRDLPAARTAPQRLGAVVFGTDQGMCGQLNDVIAATARQRLDRGRRLGLQPTAWAVGTRAATRLGDAGEPIARVYEVPGSASNVAPVVQQVALALDAWSAGGAPYEIWLVHHTVGAGGAYGPVERRILPADVEWLRELAGRRWPTGQLPLCGGDWRVVYSGLVQQYLFTSLYQAMFESLLSEHTARLAAMQMAERNIDDTLAGLRFEYHQSRQSAITSELLDIVSGFEALSRPARRNGVEAPPAHTPD